MSAEQLAAELQGLRQEPYAIYHRIAIGDSRLRVELRDGGALYFFDGDERLLCWFQLAPTACFAAGEQKNNQRPEPLAQGNSFSSSSAVTNRGRMSTGTPSSLPRTACTSGRSTTSRSISRLPPS